MPLKFFGSRNHDVPLNPNFKGGVVGEKPLILKIIHAGGIVERYYMASPAACIIEKYPKFVLTRPEIFQRPWDSIVRPDEILFPGEKYFVVPIPTLKKLRRRMPKSTVKISDGLVCQDKEITSNQTLPIGKTKPANRRVRFKGVESKIRHDSDVAEDKGKKKKSSNARGFRKKNVRFSSSHTIIDET